MADKKGLGPTWLSDEHPVKYKLAQMRAMLDQAKSHVFGDKQDESIGRPHVSPPWGVTAMKPTRAWSIPSGIAAEIQDTHIKSKKKKIDPDDSHVLDTLLGGKW